MNMKGSGLGGDDLIGLSGQEIKKQQIARRYMYLAASFSAYREWWRKKEITYTLFSLNHAYLMQAVESYFHDIHRLKDFHDIDRADRFKIASYTMRWLAKVRPIYVNDEELKTPVAKGKEALLTVNASFAFSVGCNMAGASPHDVDSKTAMEITYDLHHRDVEPGTMAHLMKLLAERWPKKQSSEKIWPKNPNL